jgi:hypothetical protein
MKNDREDCERGGQDRGEVPERSEVPLGVALLEFVEDVRDLGGQELHVAVASYARLEDGMNSRQRRSSMMNHSRELAGICGLDMGSLRLGRSMNLATEGSPVRE